MQYKLLATTALVAAGLWASTEAAFAQAKVAPISVVVGGYHEQTFGYGGNKSGRTYAFLGATASKINKMSQMSDSEIWFGGRTTLANGITVGFDVQLEANTAGDQIDESYLFIDGAFGRLVIGSENTADYIMNYSIPGVGKAYGAQESSAQSWILRPTAVTFLDTMQSGKGHGGGGNVLPGGGNDQQRVTYYTPRFWGFGAGVSYTPNVGGSTGFVSGGSFEDNNGFVDKAANRHNAFSGSVNFTNNFSGVQVNASAGITWYPKITNAATAPNNDRVVDWSVGGQLGYMGFMVGAGYRNLDVKNGAEDGYNWGVGASYVTGPFAVGLSYMTSNVEGTTTNSKNDKFHQILLSGAYTMGPGVDLIGALFHISFKDEGGATANKNSGVGAITGVRLSF
ncbi:MAG: porin [Alphaproteobacteria bacterium]|nr:porin [Alphaproteobacteria bacterium]